MSREADYEIDRVGRFEIACVPAFSDNYHWLAKIGETVAVVDPGDGQACLEAADALGWGWGGRWASGPDHQHLSLDGR